MGTSNREKRQICISSQTVIQGVLFVLMVWGGSHLGMAENTTDYSRSRVEPRFSFKSSQRHLRQRKVLSHSKIVASQRKRGRRPAVSVFGPIKPEPYRHVRLYQVSHDTRLHP